MFSGAQVSAADWVSGLQPAWAKNLLNRMPLVGGGARRRPLLPGLRAFGSVRPTRPLGPWALGDKSIFSSAATGVGHLASMAAGNFETKLHHGGATLAGTSGSG